MLRIHPIIGVFLGLSLFLSCEKKDEVPALPTKTVPFPDEFIGLDKLIPQLVTLESMQYDEQMGYHVSFVREEWEQLLIIAPVFIAPQSVSCSFQAVRSPIPESKTWIADGTGHVILNDFCQPYSTIDITDGECDAVFRMTLSLGENVPYRKVTLSGFKVLFPEWFHAEVESGPDIPELEVTAEGTVLTCRLHSIQDPARFFDEDGRLCFSLDVSFQGQATVRPEDYIGPAPEWPAGLDFRCGFDFDRIDFTSCGLQFREDSYYSEDRISSLGVLPAFFCEENSDVCLSSPRILIDFASNFPFTTTRVDAVAVFDNEYERPSATFSLSESGKFLFMPQDDGIRREGVTNVGISAMDKLFSSPFLGGTLFARLFLHPVFSTYGHFVPEKEYLMHATIDWLLPLAFTGNPHTELQTPPLRMEGTALGAGINYVHEISQEIGGRLPFDCRITPVFTLKGEEPVCLDSFVLDRNKKVKVTHQFIPGKGGWEATLHYIITPTQGNNEFFTKEHGLTIGNSVFTANKAQGR